MEISSSLFSDFDINSDWVESPLSVLLLDFLSQFLVLVVWLNVICVYLLHSIWTILIIQILQYANHLIQLPLAQIVVELWLKDVLLHVLLVLEVEVIACIYYWGQMIEVICWQCWQHLLAECVVNVASNKDLLGLFLRVFILLRHEQLVHHSVLFGHEPELNVIQSHREICGLVLVYGFLD